MLVEPLADVDVNVPGVMAILVAPAAVQLSALLVPEFMLVGSAVKEVIVGTEPFPEGEFGEVEPQPARPTQANKIRMRTSAQRSCPDEFSPAELSLFLHHELVEFMRDPLVAADTRRRGQVVSEVVIIRTHPSELSLLPTPS